MPVHRKRIDESYIPKVEKLLKQNLTIKIISERLGLNYYVVREFIEKHGLRNALDG